jgi:adenine-specific DNA methylase
MAGRIELMADEDKATIERAAQRADGGTDGGAMRTRRLIEEWLPIAEIGIESLRERTPMTPYPAPNRLHVWWARRPLVASRAAILGSLLPADADRERFMHALGIHGDPIAAKVAIEEAIRSGERIQNPYTYDRAFTYTPTAEDLTLLREGSGWNDVTPVVLDSTAGGGSIPFEAVRIGCATIANDLNAVAWLILKVTVEFPASFGTRLLKRYEELAAKWLTRLKATVQQFYPPARELNREDATYLWARTITCPYCGGVVPLSPNWRLNSSGLEARPKAVIDAAGRRIEFEISQVKKAADQTLGTVKGGDGLCPFPDCGRVIDGDEIKAQALAGKMSEQLYAVVYAERKTVGHTKSGKPKIKKVRGFRAPRAEDDVREVVAKSLAERMPEWEAQGIVPDEEIGLSNYDRGHRLYGINSWAQMFSDRQRLGHCASVEIFRELLAEAGGSSGMSPIDAAAFAYLAVAMNKCVSYNTISCRWDVVKEAVRGIFDRHGYAFQWSFGEMAPTATGLGYDWAFKQTGKAMEELIELIGVESPEPAEETLFGSEQPEATSGGNRCSNITITRGSGDDLPHIASCSVDAVVLDPPYYDNVMYAELADFFYVWLKRTAGLLFPEYFSEYLTDKDREAVANAAKFKDFSKVKGSGGSKQRAARDYQERMQGIFAEARRVLKPEGIMTLMFTHKATGAWDALAKGLVDAGFVITASWPIHTEAEGSLHIKDKNAAKSTVFLVCRPRGGPQHLPLLDGPEPVTTYWEEVEPKVTGVVRKRVREFQDAGIGGVDLYLACFGPALQVFSEHWPMIRGRAAQKPMPAKGAQFKMLEDEEWDPYAVRPEDALMAARSAVKQWRLEQLSSVPRKSQIDPVTEWFVLAWDAFKSPQFPADEALKLARVVGVNFDEKLRGKVLEVKGGDVIVWDSAMRAKKGSLGSMTSGVMVDALHHAAHAARDKNLDVAKAIIERGELDKSAAWLKALEYVLNVLPTPRMVSSSASGPIAGAAKDAEVLEKLRRLMFAKEVPPSKEWMLIEVSGEGEKDT